MDLMKNISCTVCISLFVMFGHLQNNMRAFHIYFMTPTIEIFGKIIRKIVIKYSKAFGSYG